MARPLPSRSAKNRSTQASALKTVVRSKRVFPEQTKLSAAPPHPNELIAAEEAAKARRSGDARRKQGVKAEAAGRFQADDGQSPRASLVAKKPEEPKLPVFASHDGWRPRGALHKPAETRYHGHAAQARTCQGRQSCRTPAAGGRQARKSSRRTCRPPGKTTRPRKKNSKPAATQRRCRPQQLARRPTRPPSQSPRFAMTRPAIELCGAD